MDNKNTAAQDLGSGSVPRLMLKLALPAIVAQLINMLYNVVDRIYIGHIPNVGTAALTGVGLCTPILMMVNAFAMLAAAGGAPRAAISMGQGNKSAAEKIMANCFTLLLLFAVCLTVAFSFYAEPLLRLFGASDATLPYALAYARIYLLGSTFVMITLGMNPFITTQGLAAFSMMTILIGAVCNIILDPLFIFGLSMGVKGAAIATVLSQIVSAVWVLRFLTGRKTMLKLRLSDMRPDASVILPCLALGISPFVMLSTESLLNISFNSSLARYGSDLAVGSMTILTSVSQLVSLPMTGICQGGQPLISFNFGAGKSERVKQAFRCQFISCVVYSTAFWAAEMLVPQMFAGIFTSDAELINYTAWSMRIYAASTFAFGVQISCQQGFMALGQAKISLLMACLRKLILLIPLIFILPHILPDPVFAVFLAEPISDFLAAATTGILFFTRFNSILNNPPKAKA